MIRWKDPGDEDAHITCELEAHTEVCCNEILQGRDAGSVLFNICASDTGESTEWSQISFRW